MDSAQSLLSMLWGGGLVAMAGLSYFVLKQILTQWVKTTGDVYVAHVKEDLSRETQDTMTRLKKHLDMQLKEFELERKQLYDLALEQAKSTIRLKEKLGGEQLESLGILGRRAEIVALKIDDLLSIMNSQSGLDISQDIGLSEPLKQLDAWMIDNKSDFETKQLYSDLKQYRKDVATFSAALLSGNESYTLSALDSPGKEIYELGKDALTKLNDLNANIWSIKTSLTAVEIK